MGLRVVVFQKYAALRKHSFTIQI